MRGGRKLLGLVLLPCAIAAGVVSKRSSSKDAALAPRSASSTGLSEAEILAQLEAEFRAQAGGTPWSRDAREELARAFASDLAARSELGTIECRADLCRVEMTHPNLQAFHTFIRAALLDANKKLSRSGFSAQVLAQGPAGVRTVTFIRKEGQPILPLTSGP